MNQQPPTLQPSTNGPAPEYLAQVLRQARLRIEELEERDHAPLAIIGMGCRFPAAASPTIFWQNLLAGHDAITEIPEERWDVTALYSAIPTPGKMSTRWGGFLERIDEFDAEFFGISGLEAAAIDPQQRLLLEVAWEALEDAGINPRSLTGSRTGVFIGISGNDYMRLQQGTPHESSAYAGVGNALSIAANRLSYLLDLHGPSMAIDTACSSSLVAVHHACHSLRRGECDQALVGGVNLILSPAITVAFSQAGMMAADGRCKTFDARADGYVRSEGAGVVLLKRATDALRDGDAIFALIAGTAINQDGRSNGLTAPNGLAQQAVIRQALDDARVSPAQVSYVETHGTGTALGDPIEVNALKAVLTADRTPDQPCWLGTVKPNIGHLEAAAGMAGLIKTVLALHHQQIPRQLHLQTLNPHITLAASGLAIPQQTEPWPVAAESHYAGVSSFGFGGTNAHLILTEAPLADQLRNTAAATPQLFTLSAKTEPALRNLAQAYANRLATDEPLALADLCFTVNTGRAHFAQRLALVVNDRQQLQERLAAYAAGQVVPGLVTNPDLHQRPQVAFLFTGQGAQLCNAGRQLYATEPTFRRTLTTCDAILQPLLGASLLDLLYPSDAAPAAAQATLLADTLYAQPALFALEYALAQCWLAWGITPTVVMGHSVGELVAACVAGAFSLEEGLWLVAMRGRLMGSLPANGAMAALFAGAADVTALLQQSQSLRQSRGQLAIAAINGAAQTVVAGEREALTAFLAELSAQAIESRLLPVGYAFHSPLMDPILDALEQTAGNLDYQPLQLPLVSTTTGALLPVGYTFTAHEWRTHARQPVCFTEGVDQLVAQGSALFLEIGPQPLLGALGQAYNSDPTLQWLPSLSPQSQAWTAMAQSLATLYVHGASVDWPEFYRGETYQRLRLPTYRFQRQRYWFSDEDFTMQQPNGQGSAYNPPSSNGHANRMNGRSSSRSAEVRHALQRLVAELLHVDVATIGADTPFVELGADSIVLIGAVRRIENDYGIAIAMRRFFEDLSTLTALSKYIAQNLAPDWSPARQPATAAVPAPQHRTSAVASQPPVSLSRPPRSAAEPVEARERGGLLTQPHSNGTDALPATTTQQLLDIITKQLDLLGHCFPSPPAAPTTHPTQEQRTQDQPIALPLPSTPVDPQSQATPLVAQPQIIPLSEAQQQLWFLSQISDEASIAYNESVSLCLHGALNVTALHGALQTVVDRHEALRTRISPAGDTQEILPSLAIDLPLFDFSELTEPTQRTRVTAWFEEESRRLLNLATGPLFRVYLLKLADDDHILGMTAHHIIIDGWSMGVLLQELGSLYNAACQAQTPTLPPPPQFSQQLAWQRAALARAAMAHHEAYWLQSLSGDLPLLELPLDHARPPIKSYRGAIETVRLNPERTHALRQLSGEQGCTLFMTLFAAYATLLHRLAGQEEIMIGIPNAGRTMPGSAGIVGYCAHLLPIRNQLRAEQHFSDLLQRTRARLLDAYEHQEYPFARLVNKLSGARDLSLSPVVSSTFTLTKQPALPTLAGLTATLGPRPASFVDHELSLNVIEHDAELIVDFEYNCDLFDAATVKRIAGYFTTLLDAIISNPTQSLLALPLLTAAERHQLLVEWNSTDLAFDPTLSFQQLFEAQVARTPDAVAVRFACEALTYAELNSQANRIAHQLRGQGVGVDTLVAILCDRSPAFLAAMLGIFKAGGAYLPLDVRAPAARQSQILAQSQTPLLLITADFADAAAEALAHFSAEQPSQVLPEVLHIEALLAQSNATTNLPLLTAATDPGARLAYVIYTSGSTGLPKGAMVEHRGMINHLYAKIKDLHLTAGDIVAQTAPQSFDISVWQFLSTLILGGQIEIFPDAIAADPMRLLQGTAQQQITILEVVPSLLRTMVDEIGRGLAPDLSCLRYMIPTGEALPPNLARQWLRHCPAIPLVNAYGPTECSDDVTHYFVTTPPHEGVVNMSIGRPIINMRMYILDANRQPVPIGVAGELYVGGIGVGRGYIHDAERTAAAFVADPFHADPHARLYKTGDKARYLADGNIEYLGRLDYQVKLRGFRIELGEIEAVLEEEPTVRQAVVIDRVDQNNSKYLVAYLTPNDPTMADPATAIDIVAVRAFVKQRLPDYMVPALFMPLTTLPLTNNGKLDRKALPIPDGDIWGATVPYIAPETALQSELVTIWADVLNLAPATIGIHHSFFELGGHSLLAGQIISRVRTAFAVDLPIRDLMENPTVAGMAASVESRTAETRLLPFGQEPLPRTADQSYEVIEL